MWTQVLLLSARVEYTCTKYILGVAFILAVRVLVPVPGLAWSYDTRYPGSATRTVVTGNVLEILHRSALPVRYVFMHRNLSKRKL